MAIGGALIWSAVMGVAVYAVLGRNKPASERFADRLILGGGVILPTVVLAALLTYGLRLLPAWRTEDAPDLRVAVTGEQFWWRIAYELADGTRVETANELHLPVGRVVEFELAAHDVIHSFWVPPLGGKLDLVPGRRNLLRLTPSETGRFRGVCAEFCGPSHALMAFQVVVHEPEAFDAWLAAEAAPSDSGADASAFRTAGCGACHQVRGLVAEGAVGPDLTHLARRETLAAGTLPMSEAALSAWLTDPAAVKPDARMPAFGHLSQDEHTAILAFLMTLR
jgi:cytochrome c oxidase subunit 2